MADQYVLDVFILNSWEGEVRLRTCYVASLEAKHEDLNECTSLLQKDALERALRERLSQWQPSEKGRASVDDVSPAVPSFLFFCHALTFC